MKILSAVFVLLFLTSQVNAHLFGGNDDIGILLYTEPGEPPIPGEASNITFYVADPKTSYVETIDGVDIDLKVILNDRTLIQEKVTQKDDVLRVPFTFEYNDYKIDITVSPGSEYEGEPFFPVNSEFDIILVEETPAEEKTNFNYLLGILFVVVLIGLIVFMRK